jgi:hypothetical protein
MTERVDSGSSSNTDIVLKEVGALGRYKLRKDMLPVSHIRGVLINTLCVTMRDRGDVDLGTGNF